MPIKAVVFDLDGTITNFNLDYKVVRAEVRGHLLKMGVPASVLNVNETVFEMLKKTELFMKNSGKTDSVIERIRKEVFSIAEKYELEAATSTNLLPGVIDTLKALRLAGLKMALCTLNSQKSTNYILTRFKLTEYFDTTVPRDNVISVKPHPEHLKTALDALGISAAETMAIGDSVSDIKVAKELNVLAIGLTTGISTQDQLAREGANYVITSITDLPILIECINKEDQEPTTQ
jgi:HAD superfamily hydrolase (TIGR01509 family)